MFGHGWATTYYVDSSSEATCDGTTTGTTDGGDHHCAFDTIAHADAVFTGDMSDNSLLFNKGDTWREQYTVTAFGTDGHPATIGAYGTGDDPIISGADLVATWAEVSGESNFGDTNAPGDADQYLDDYVYYQGVSVTSAGTLIALKMYVQDGNGTVAKMALYDDNGGVPGNLVSGSDSGEVTLTDGTPGWYTFTPSGSPSLSIGTYYMAYWGATQNIVAARTNVGSGCYDGYEGLTYDGNYPATADPDAGANRDCEYDQYIVVSTTVANGWQATLNTEPHNVFFNGTEGTHEAGSCPGDLNTDQEWCWDSNVLYQYSATDPDSRYTSPGTEATQRDTVISADGKSYITIDGLQLEKTNGTVEGHGNVLLDDCQYITLQNNKIYYGGMSNISALKSGGTSSHITIDSNELKYVRNYGAWSLNVKLLDTSDSTISENDFEDCNDGATCGQFVATGDSADSNIIEKNHLHGTTIDGISLDNGDSNIVRYNFVEDGGVGGVCLEDKNAADDNVFLGNIAKNCAVAIQGDGTVQSNDGVSYINNTVYWESGVGSGYGLSLIVSNTNTTVKNNIVYLNHTNDATAFVATGTITGLDADHNDWLNGCTHALINYGAGWYGCSDFASYKAASSQDANSISSDPLFTNAGSGDFRLLPGSPACFGGTYVAGYTTKPSWICDDITNCDTWIEDCLSIGVYPCPKGARLMGF
jgi:parallel beta-helix repeat protein